MGWLTGKEEVDFGSLWCQSGIKCPVGLNVISLWDGLQDEKRSALGHFCVGRGKASVQKKGGTANQNGVYCFLHRSHCNPECQGTPSLTDLEAFGPQLLSNKIQCIFKLRLKSLICKGSWNEDEAEMLQCGVRE